MNTRQGKPQFTKDKHYKLMILYSKHSYLLEVRREFWKRKRESKRSKVKVSERKKGRKKKGKRKIKIKSERQNAREEEM